MQCRDVPICLHPLEHSSGQYNTQRPEIRENATPYVHSHTT